MKLKFLFIAGVACSLISYSQSKNHTISDGYFQLNVGSPGITDFVKYGNMPVSLFTGETSVTIPIISVPVTNQNPIEVSLGYSSSGFRPSKRPGLVGMNWYLNVGGSITREVRGMPDDQKGVPNSNGGSAIGNYTNGFIVGTNSKQHDKWEVYNHTTSTGYKSDYQEWYLYGSSPNDGDSVLNYEASPDIFSFNFNGISGKFFMGNDNIVKVVTNQPNSLKVDLSGFTFQPSAGGDCTPLASEIIITDNQGNKYYFGGALKNMEYSISLGQSSTGALPQLVGARPVITAWNMYKIQYYNGNTVNFNYYDDTAFGASFCKSSQAIHGQFADSQTGVFPVKKDFVVLNEYVSHQKSIISISGSMPGTGGPAGGGNTDNSYELLKIAILEKIEADDFTINFTYSRQPHAFNTRNDGENGALTGLYSDFLDIKLDEVKLSGKGSGSGQRKKMTFGYTQLGGLKHSRMFLTSLTEQFGKPYTFEYSDPGTLPKPITYGIDHWGFWNGKNDNTNYLTPQINYDIATGDYTYATTGNGTARNPIFSYAMKGQLIKVNYPTGGYTEFEYEEHQYKKRLDIKSANGFIPALYDVIGIAGGTRIKKIKDFDGISDTNIKEYQYVDLKNPSASDGGLLLQWPRYVSYWQTPSGSVKFGYIRSSTINKNIMESAIVTYPEVTEVNNGNGYTVHKFSNYVSTPDEDLSSVWDTGSYANVVPSGLAKNFIGYYLNDKSIERGKLVWKKTYDAANLLKQEETYEYNVPATRFNDYSTTIHLSFSWQQANKMYYYPYYQTKKVTTNYLVSGNIVQQDESVFDAKHNLTNSIMNTSDATQTLETRYYYPTTGSPLYADFVAANKFGTVLRKEQYRGGIIFSADQTDYAKDATTNNLLLPKTILAAKYQGGSPIIPLEPRFTFNKYDTRANPLDVSLTGGIRTVYLWGYSKTRPIAKIENATFLQVATALGINEAALLSYTEANLAAINNLRTNVNLPGAMITTYTHLPLTGITSITDPKGYQTQFAYDSLNRVQFITDSNGNTLSEFNYHFKN